MSHTNIWGREALQTEETADTEALSQQVRCVQKNQQEVRKAGVEMD